MYIHLFQGSPDKLPSHRLTVPASPPSCKCSGIKICLLHFQIQRKKLFSDKIHSSPHILGVRSGTKIMIPDQTTGISDRYIIKFQTAQDLSCQLFACRSVSLKVVSSILICLFTTGLAMS